MKVDSESTIINLLVSDYFGIVVKEGKELSMHKRTAIRVEYPNQHVGMNWLREAAVISAAGLFITVWATLVSRVFTFSYTSSEASLMIGEVVFWTGSRFDFSERLPLIGAATQTSTMNYLGKSLLSTRESKR